MNDIWEKLEVLNKEKNGRSLQLRTGAALKKIAKAEETMKLEFPLEFRDYLLLHDGQDNDEEAGLWRLGSLAEIVAQWKDEREQEKEYPEENTGFVEKDKILNRLRCPQWIPFLGAPFWDQDIAYIDLSPGPKGKIGQVIALVTECDFKVLAPSFNAFLERWLKKGSPI